MKNSAKYFFLLILLLSALSGWAQEFNFHHLTINDGLPSDKVNAITQDQQGFMYFATSEGLVRYDGSRMKLFRNNPDDSTSIAVNKVKALFTDHAGFIWCAHDQYGVSVFNPGTEKFNRIPFKNFNRSGKFEGYISSIHQDNRGDLYICTFGDNQAVFKIHPGTYQTEQFFLLRADPFHLLTEANNNVFDLSFYNDTLWLAGTTNGLVFYNPVKNEVWKVLKTENTNTESWKNFYNGFVTSNSGTVYYGSWASGLHFYNMITGEEKNYFRVQNRNDLKACSPHFFINDSVLLLTGWDVFLLNINTGIITFMRQDLLNQYAVTGNASNAFRSADGTIWLSTLSGVNYFNPGKNDFRSIFLASDVERLLINPAHEQHWIWYDRMTQTYIINYFIRNRDDKKFILSVYDENFNHLADIPNPVANEGAAFCNNGNNKGKLYFSGSEKNKTGLYELDVASHHVKNILAHTPYRDSLIISALTWNQDTLLALDLDQGILLEINTSDYTVASCKKITRPDGVYFGVRSRSPVYENKTRSFWLPSESGLFQMNRTDPVISPFRNSDLDSLLKGRRSVFSLLVDVNNHLWISHAGGITCLNTWTGKTEFHFTEKELPSVNTWQLLPDSAGCIWSDCSKGLLRIDYSNRILRLYNTSNGLQPRCYPGTAAFLANGSLSMPFPGGLMIYDTGKKEVSRVPAPPVITSIKSFDNEYKSDTAVSFLHAVSWPYSSNSITVEFSSLHYLPSGIRHYAYKLEGLNADFTITANPQFTYANLEPGHYILHLKSSADGNLYSPERLLSLTIVPPWYRTVIFRLLLLIAGILSILLAYRIRISQVRKEEQLKTTFNRKLMDMELTALRSQMNPHFIFNSLNSINRYVIQNDRLTASEYIAKFGKLMRNVLDNSRSSAISLQQEFNTLELYLQLEKLRFENKFTYTIFVDTDLDATIVMVPPLLIQPFVENSIWHGLMHKEGNGHVHIQAVLKNEKLLEIIVEDDGIGREKAAELKKEGTSHHSHGIQVTSERIKIINEIYRQQNRVEVTDLYNGKQDASGTRVSILIPLNSTEHD